MSLRGNCVSSGSELPTPRQKVLVACSGPLKPLYAGFARSRSPVATGAEAAATEAGESFHRIKQRPLTALSEWRNGG